MRSSLASMSCVALIFLKICRKHLRGSPYIRWAAKTSLRQVTSAWNQRAADRNRGSQLYASDSIYLEEANLIHRQQITRRCGPGFHVEGIFSGHVFTAPGTANCKALQHRSKPRINRFLLSPHEDIDAACVKNPKGKPIHQKLLISIQPLLQMSSRL